MGEDLLDLLEVMEMVVHLEMSDLMPCCRCHRNTGFPLEIGVQGVDMVNWVDLAQEEAEYYQRMLPAQAVLEWALAF